MALAQRIHKSSIGIQAIYKFYRQQSHSTIQIIFSQFQFHSAGKKSSLPVHQLSSKFCYGNIKCSRWDICLSSQRRYSQPPWIWPLGKINHPKKKDFKESNTTALVQLEDISPQSLTCLERLHDAASSLEVFDVLQERSRDSITPVHYGCAVCRLAEIHADERYGASEKGLVPVSRAPVLYDNRFRDLCQIVLQESRHMENRLFLEVLGSMRELRIPLKSSFMYTLLVQAEQRLNTFRGGELAQFAGILDRLDRHDPRVSALMSAVGILTVRHISDLRTLPQVIVLINTVGTTLDGVSRGKLANMLLAVLAADEERTLDDIIQAVLALHKMDYRLDMLLELASPILTENTQELGNRELYKLACALGGLRYPDNNFFMTTSECILERIDVWEVSHLIDVVDAFSSVEIKVPLFFDSVVKKVMECREWTPSVNTFTTFVRSLVDLDHRPPTSWNFPEFACATVSKLLPNLSLLPSGDCKHVIILANSLASMDIFPEDLLELAASRKFANAVMMIKDGREYQTVIRDLQNLMAHLKDANLLGRDNVMVNLMKLVPMG